MYGAARKGANMRVIRSGTPSLPDGWPRFVRSAVLHALSMASVVSTAVRGRAENQFDAGVRLRAEIDRLRNEISLLQEELRIKDARMERLPAQRRPHYPPVERLAILELRGARSWSQSETARRLLVTPLTVASWMRRLDDEGPDALVQMREPVNRFPDFVGYLVRSLKTLNPTCGTRRIATSLARAGLHLGATTVRRMARPPVPKPSKTRRPTSLRVVTAKKPNSIWHVDLTTVPTSGGFWVSLLPFAILQCWPFCWWVAVVVDHFSRRGMGFAVFKSQPSAVQLKRFLDRTCKKVGCRPRHIISDQGPQFTADELEAWCGRRDISQRFGAIGKYGSIAVVERFIRSLKNECTRRLFLVPYRLCAFQEELSLYFAWYNADRPHSWLRGKTPDEVYFGRFPASRRPRYEPRARWPRRSPCAMPHALVRGRPGAQLELDVVHRAGRRHLPVVELKRVA